MLLVRLVGYDVRGVVRLGMLAWLTFIVVIGGDVLSWLPVLLLRLICRYCNGMNERRVCYSAQFPN